MLCDALVANREQGIELSAQVVLDALDYDNIQTLAQENKPSVAGLLQACKII